jgi:hypothetical protein
MDGEQLSVRRRVCDLLRLAVVGDKPLELAERDTLAVLQNIKQLFLIFWIIKKTFQTREQKCRLVH